MSCDKLTIGISINDLVNQKDDHNLTILTLWLYWIIVGEPDKRDSFARGVDK